MRIILCTGDTGEYVGPLLTIWDICIAGWGDEKNSLRPDPVAFGRLVFAGAG